MNYRLKTISMFFLFLTSILFPQENQSRTDDLDSLKENSSIIVYPMNELKKAWKFFNYPILPNSTVSYYGSYYPTSQLNSLTYPNNFNASKEEMLAQFRLQQNWNSKNKFSAFTKYLGYAQFLGAMSLLGIHIYQWSNLKNLPTTPQTNSFNRYKFTK